MTILTNVINSYQLSYKNLIQIHARFLKNSRKDKMIRAVEQ